MKDVFHRDIVETHKVDVQGPEKWAPFSKEESVAKQVPGILLLNKFVARDI